MHKKRFLGFVALLAAVIVPRALAADKPAPKKVPEIAEVKTLEELRALKPITLNDGWKVRIGFSDGGKDAGPWKLIYCLARRLEPLNREITYEGEMRTPLGPVMVQVDYRDEAGVKAAKDLVAGQYAGVVPKEGLYCDILPVAWAGRYHVRVFSFDGALLGERILKVDKPQACAWQEFTAMRKGGAAVPQSQRRRSLVPKDQGDRVQEAVKGADGKPATPLPWKIEEAAGCPLKLALKKGVFVVSADYWMVDEAGNYLLARWWRNGKMVIPERAESGKAVQRAGRVSFTKVMRVEFGLPENLGDVRSGDKITLQVLYSPSEVRRLCKFYNGQWMRAEVGARPNLAVVPLLSNRIEFKVTEEMLKPTEQK